MPTIADITNAASYKGSMELGGGGGIAIEFDTKPIQDLARYTFIYNQAKWQQQQKDADNAIVELAKQTAFDPINGIRKDIPEVAELKTRLQKAGRDYASQVAKTPQERTQQYIKYKQEIGEIEKGLNSANGRALSYMARKNEIMKGTGDAAQKDLEIKQLEREFDDTDILTPISAMPKLNLAMPVSGDPIYEDVTYLRETPNGMIKETKKQFSLAANNKMSFLEGNNLLPPVLPPNATQLQKDEYEQRKLAFSKTENGILQNAAQFFNAAVNDPNYKKTVTTNGINVTGEQPTTTVTEEIDIDQIKSTNPIVGGIISVAERYNKYAKDRIAEIKQGYYIDNVTGEKLLLTAGDKVEDISLIDVTKPISAANLDLLQKFAKASPDKVEKTFTQTDNAIQQAQLSETIRNNKADQYLKGKEIKLNEDKWKATQTGGETQINGAMERAKRIYGDLVKIAGQDGIISPDDIRKLNTEQLKYLGIENVETSEQGVPRSIFKPLNLSEGEKGKDRYIIQLTDGNVKVMKNAKLAENGKAYVGEWDNTKSTNLFNIGTNILNEELKNSGAKELNAYMGIDVIGGITSNTSGGSTTTSGSVKSKITDYSSDVQAGIKAFMKANNYTEEEAIRVLKENNRIK